MHRPRGEGKINTHLVREVHRLQQYLFAFVNY
jgi:hypothetical protein